MPDDDKLIHLNESAKKILERLTERERKKLKEWYRKNKVREEENLRGKSGLDSDKDNILIVEFGEDFIATRKRIKEIEKRALKLLKKRNNDPPDDVA